MKFKRDWTVAFLVTLFTVSFLIGQAHRAEAAGNCGWIWKDCTTGQPNAAGGLSLPYVPWSSVEGTGSLTSTATNVLVHGGDSRLSDARQPAGNITVGANLGLSTGTAIATSTSVALSATPKVQIVGDGNAAHYLDGSGAWSTPAGGGGGGAWPGVDSYTGIYWSMDGSAPYANEGNAGTLAWTVLGNASILGRAGIKNFGANLVSYNTNSSYGHGFFTTGNTSLGESNSVTVSYWIKLRSYGSQWAGVQKAYRNDNTWTSPYFTYNLGFMDGHDGRVQFAICTVGVGNSGVTMSQSTDYVPLNTWTFLAGTYNASTGETLLYRDGAVVASGTITASNLDYGTHGPIIFGNAVPGADEWVLGNIDDVRIESTVRSATYLQTLAWAQGNGH